LQQGGTEAEGLHITPLSGKSPKTDLRLITDSQPFRQPMFCFRPSAIESERSLSFRPLSRARHPTGGHIPDFQRRNTGSMTKKKGGGRALPPPSDHLQFAEGVSLHVHRACCSGFRLQQIPYEFMLSCPSRPLVQRFIITWRPTSTCVWRAILAPADQTPR
jgi:hypothetical protein